MKNRTESPLVVLAIVAALGLSVAGLVVPGYASCEAPECVNASCAITYRNDGTVSSQVMYSMNVAQCLFHDSNDGNGIKNAGDYYQARTAEKATRSNHCSEPSWPVAQGRAYYGVPCSSTRAWSPELTPRLLCCNNSEKGCALTECATD